MKLRHLAALGAVAAVIGIGVTAPYTATADTDCNTHVIDTTDKRVLDADVVNKSVTATSDATGADVYVRAMQTTPGGDAAVWFKDALRECRNWTGPDGVTPKPNLLVVQFGMDHTSSIQYGRNLTASMDPKVDKVRSSVMGSQLKSGNFTKAMTQTLDTVSDIYGGKDPFAAPPSAPTNWSPFLTILKWIAGIIASAVALFYSFVFGSKFMRRRARRKAELADARKTYDDAYARITDLVVSTDLNAELIRADAAATKIDFDYKLEPSDKLCNEFANINDEFVTLSATSVPKDAESFRTLTKEYRTLIDRFESLLKRANNRANGAEEAARSSTPESKKLDLDGSLDRGKKLSKEIGKLPKWADTSKMTQNIAEASNLVGDAIGKVDTLTRPEVDDIFYKANTLLDLAYDEVNEVSAAQDRVENAVKRVDTALSNYRKPVDDVPDNVRKDALKKFMMLSPRAHEFLDKIRSGESLTVKKVDAGESLITSEYEGILITPRNHISAAEERRAEERRIAEREEQRKREEERKNREKEERKRREEEAERRRERERRNESFGGGFAGGYLGGSLGSSSSSSYDSGSSWGGSSGSWGGGFDSGGSSGGW